MNWDSQFKDEESLSESIPTSKIQPIVQSRYAVQREGVDLDRIMELQFDAVYV